MPDPTPDIAVDTTVPATIYGRKTKLALTGVFASSFYAVEWGLVGITAALVTFLKYRGLSDVSLWLVLWTLNLIVSGTVVLLNSRTDIDFTLMETSRLWTNAATRKSKWIGYPLECMVFIRLLLWDGPDQLLIFFKERLPSRFLKCAFFVVASGFQMFIWAKLYVLGYENIGDLLKMVW